MKTLAEFICSTLGRFLKPIIKLDELVFLGNDSQPFAFVSLSLEVLRILSRIRTFLVGSGLLKPDPDWILGYKIDA
jgi:hypothetical protein